MRPRPTTRTNVAVWQPPTVTLIDGQQVLSTSEEYRHECEARAVLRMPTLAQRRSYLFGTMDERGIMRGGVRGRRGKAACDRLEATIKTIFYAGRSA